MPADANGDKVNFPAQPHGRSMPGAGVAAATGAAAAALGSWFADDADGEFHFLKGDLFADAFDELLGHRIGRSRTVELEADGLAGELGEGLGHLAVEGEAEVGVDFLLELEEARLGAVPEPGLDHDEDGFAGLAVEGQGIETAGIFDAECAGRGGLGFGLAAGFAHGAKEWTRARGLSKAARMKAIRVHAFGGPEVMQPETVPDPVPGAGQVVVRLMAAGVNPVDTYIRSGKYGKLPALPYTPGADGAGVIAAAGGGTPWKAGQRVWVAGSISGTYAEAALCETGRIFALPDAVSFAQGAALGIPYTTAYRALFQRGNARPAETVFIHGATGGVGLAAVQFARAAGLRVLATGGTEAGRALLAREGADEIFDHTSAGYMDAVLAATGGRGVDVILEMLAHVNLARDLTVLGRNGRVIVIGSRAAIEVTPRELMLRDADIRGVMVSNTPAPELAECHAAIAGGLAAGTFKPVIGWTLPLEAAPQAHEQVMGAGRLGKIVLQTGGAA